MGPLLSTGTTPLLPTITSTPYTLFFPVRDRYEHAPLLMYERSSNYMHHLAKADGATLRDVT